MGIFNFFKRKEIKFNNETLKKALHHYMDNKISGKLKYGNISKWNVSDVTNMSELFYSFCSSCSS